MTANPGSREAADAGCICAVLDNNRGIRPPYPPDGWWITAGCKVHDSPAYAAQLRIGTENNPLD